MNYYNSIVQFLDQYSVMLASLATLSVLTFVGTLLLVPIMVISLPEDYFCRPKRNGRHHKNLIMHYILLSLKNMLGFLFILAGVAMLVLPGQGLLTLMIGLMVMDFPGKYRFEKWLISKSAILNSINWIRSKAGKSVMKL